MKLAFVGAGSYGFTRRLIGDILVDPPSQDIELALMDIDLEKLAIMKDIIERLIAANRCRARVYATADRRDALRGADVVVVTVRAGRLADIRGDHQIPAQFGMRQTVGDTLGPGGVFYGIRNIAVLTGVCRDMEDVAPNGLLLNYTNPMAIAMSVLQRSSGIRSIGLCHSVQNTVGELCGILGIASDQVSYLCGGVNHTAWFLQFEHLGHDLYPLLHDLAQKPEVFARDPVRFDLMQHFHYFPTESSRHHAEYHPYYLHRDDECARLSLRYNQGAGWYTPERYGRHTMEGLRTFAQSADVTRIQRSNEYFVPIVKAFFTDQPVRIYGSMVNAGLILQLPPTCAVEVPVYVDGGAFEPMKVEMPVGGATARTAAVALHQAIAAEGILRKDLRLIREAVFCDPSTSAACDVHTIERMVDALIEQNRTHLQGYKDSRVHPVGIDVAALPNDGPAPAAGGVAV